MLILAAPAIVAIVDEAAHINIENPIEYNEENIFGVTRIGTASTDVQIATNVKDVALLPSENDGFFLVDTKQTTVTNPDRMVLNLLPVVRDMFSDGDVSRVVIYAEDSTLVYLRITSAAYGNYSLIFNEESPGVWVLDLSSVDKMKLKGSTEVHRLNIIYGAGNVPAFAEFSFAMYGDDIPLYYASLVWGAIGVLLIIVAIYSTHLVQVGDLSKKIGKIFRRKGKGGKK